MKSTKLFIAFFAICFIFLMLLLSGCGTSKISQLPADTIRIVDKQIHYDIQTIVHDSIVTKTDTFDNFIFRDKIIYQTNTKTKTDTIFSDKEAIRMNPLNEQIKSERDKLAKTLKNRNKLIWVLLGLIILIGLGIKFLK